MSFQAALDNYYQLFETELAMAREAGVPSAELMDQIQYVDHMYGVVQTAKAMYKQDPASAAAKMRAHKDPNLHHIARALETQDYNLLRF